MGYGYTWRGGSDSAISESALRKARVEDTNQSLAEREVVLRAGEEVLHQFANSGALAG